MTKYAYLPHIRYVPLALMMLSILAYLSISKWQQQQIALIHIDEQLPEAEKLLKWHSDSIESQSPIYGLLFYFLLPCFSVILSHKFQSCFMLFASVNLWSASGTKSFFTIFVIIHDMSSHDLHDHVIMSLFQCNWRVAVWSACSSAGETPKRRE